MLFISVYIISVRFLVFIIENICFSFLTRNTPRFFLTVCMEAIGLFTRYESFSVYIKRYPITILFLFLSVAMFLAMSVVGSSTSTFTLYQFGALLPESMSRSGEWYRFFSAIFIHIGIMHLVMNGVFLYVFAPYIEKKLGKTRYFFFFILSGALSFLFPFFLNPDTITAGASGALYSLLAMHVFLIWKEPFTYAQGDKQAVYVITIFGFIMSFFTPGVSFAGHVGGFVMGFILSFIFYKNKFFLVK